MVVVLLWTRHLFLLEVGIGLAPALLGDFVCVGVDDLDLKQRFKRTPFLIKP